MGREYQKLEIFRYGRENVKNYLKENPDILHEVEEKVRANFEKAFEESLGEELPSVKDEDEEE